MSDKAAPATTPRFVPLIVKPGDLVKPVGSRFAYSVIEVVPGGDQYPASMIVRRSDESVVQVPLTSPLWERAA